MAAVTEPHSPKEKMPLPPRELRDEVIKQQVQPVKLRPTEVCEKIVLPTEEDIKFEKHQQCNSPILSDVASFNRDSLRHSQTDEKTCLPTSEEYNQIKMKKEISHFDPCKLKHVETDEKHEVAAIAVDESGDKCCSKK